MHEPATRSHLVSRGLATDDWAFTASFATVRFSITVTVETVMHSVLLNKSDMRTARSDVKPNARKSTSTLGEGTRRISDTAVAIASSMGE